MNRRVQTAWEVVYADPIRFSKGEQVTITEKRDLWEGIHLWVWCIDAEGREGWVPAPVIEIEGDSAVAKRDYNALELPVEAGEMLEVLETLNGWCWCRTQTGKEGWVPTQNLASARD